MADNIWDASTDTDGNVAANWSLNRVPTGTDVAVFDHDTTDDNCTFSGNISCQGMRFDNAYAGTVDAATHDITLTTDGLDCTGGGSATLDLGSGTWIMSGDFDCGLIGTLDDGTSTIEMSGTHSLKTPDNVPIYNLTVKAGATTTWDNDVGSKRGRSSGVIEVEATGTLIYDAGNSAWDMAGNTTARTINGTLTLNKSCIAKGVWTFGAASTLDGSATLLFSIYSTASPCWDVHATATISIGAIEFRCYMVGNGNKIKTFSAPTTDVSLLGHRATACGILFTDGGTLTCSDLTVGSRSAGDFTVYNSTNNPSFDVKGHVAFGDTAAGSTIYNEGSGTITLGGGGDPEIDFNDEATEEIINDKTGGNVKFTGGVTCDWFEANSDSAGNYTIDINGQTITSNGKVDIDGGADGADFYDTGAVSSDMNNGKFVIGNTGASAGTIDGINGSPIEIDNLDFDLQNGSTLTAVWCDIEDSDVTNGTGDATSNCTEGANNTNWDFGAAGGISQILGGGILV